MEFINEEQQKEGEIEPVSIVQKVVRTALTIVREFVPENRRHRIAVEEPIAEPIEDNSEIKREIEP